MEVCCDVVLIFYVWFSVIACVADTCILVPPMCCSYYSGYLDVMVGIAYMMCLIFVYYIR